MATGTGSARVVKRTAIQQSVEVLKGLPVKEPEQLALREAVFEMLPAIEGVLARGYSLDEVAAILSGNGIEIKGTTLKQYLREGRKSRSRKRSQAAKPKGNLDSKDLGKEAEPQMVELHSSEAKPEDAIAGEPLHLVKGKSKASDQTTGRTVGKFTEVPDDL